MSLGTKIIPGVDLVGCWYTSTDMPLDSGSFEVLLHTKTKQNIKKIKIKKSIPVYL